MTAPESRTLVPRGSAARCGQAVQGHEGDVNFVEVSSPTFHDFTGRVHDYDGVSPIVWRISAYAIAVRQDMVLVMEPTYAQGRWELPGGGIHAHETLAEGVARECWEETGHHFVPAANGRFHYLGEAFFYLSTTVEPAASPYRHSVLLAVEGEARPGPGWTVAGSQETRRVAWLPLRELVPQDLPPHHWLALNMAGVVPAGTR